ncbi:acyl-CoA dehydrogenase family protein [Micromonospora sp. NPDC047753]|uniref:acyl-CoA dehydrogenase family protein n=1 Tax=Micromonospora sp. NPDC047753 TaxID=3154817 RepID=UPI0033D095C1
MAPVTAASVLASTVGSRCPQGAADVEFATRLDAFTDRHRDGLLAAGVWESAGPPVRELLRAVGEAGLLRDAWAERGGDRAAALWRAAALHRAFARVGNGAPGAALLTHLEVATRLLGVLPTTPVGLVADALAGSATSALAATEPDGGSDLTALKTTVGAGAAGGLTVTGTKWFISNAPYADHLLVLADDRDGRTGRRGPALLLVSAGPRVGVTTLDGLGHTGLTGAVVLDAAPVAAVLAVGGHGLLVLMRHWIHERVMLAVRMAELAESVLDHAVADAGQRITFGVPLITNQHVRFTLARLDAAIQEVQAMAGQSLRLLAAGACPGGWAAAGKHRAAAVLAEVADEALQLSGADGYRRGHPAERALRDATGLALAGGTTELMLQQIDRG